MQGRGLITGNFLNLAQAPVGPVLAEAVLQTFGGQSPVYGAGLEREVRLLPVQVVDYQAVGVGFYLQAVGFQTFVQGLPVLGMFQGFQNFAPVALGV